MRLFVLIVISAVLVVGAAATPLFAQESTADYRVTPPSKSETQPAPPPQSDSIVNWWGFHAAWALAVMILFALFYFHRDRKQKVLAAGKVEKDLLPNLGKMEQRIGFIMLVALAFATVILIINALWMPLIILLASVAALYVTFPEILTELAHIVWTGTSPTDHMVRAEKTKFENVGGLAEVIEEFQEIIGLLKDPKESEEWGITPPKGVLLYGPPGCGKTLLARAVAGEAGVPFFQHSGASVGTSYVRSGAQHVITMFAGALAKAPSIIFIDEFDALGRRRGQDSSGEFDHALTEVLHQMDGIKERSGVLIIAATNREDSIDEALMRPGRFGRGILIPPPDKSGRAAILKVHTSNKHLAEDVDLLELAERIPGFTGDDIRALANKATVIARRRYEAAKKQWNIVETVVDSVKGLFTDQKIVNKEDFEKALDESLGGLARKSALSNAEQKIIAEHEMGHAIVTAEKGLEVLEKITLTQRNWALGMTLSRGEETHLFSKAAVLARITSLLGGRAAEKVFLGPKKVTSGAANDFEKAAELTRRMVCEWGMGEDGPGVFAKLDSARPGQRPFSEHTAQKIDGEVQKIIDACMADAEAIVTANKDTVEYLAELLIQRTNMDGKEFLKILEERKPKKA
ncbi:MAG: AAA family ATPase [Candidatus Sungiibacteriota bacterium]